MAVNLLSIKDLTVEFSTDRGRVKALDGMNLEINEQETIGLVGESGSGKSMTALSILRLIPSPPGQIVSGTISLSGKNLLELPERDLRHIRGHDISMIFQEPMTALNPVFTIGNQLIEVIKRHKKLSSQDALAHAIKQLEMVSIPSAAKRTHNYPHELSGGMRQRVMIAMALACGPKLLIADEPTSALDVTTQAQVLQQIRILKNTLKTSMLLITHDLSEAIVLGGRVAVMTSGPGRILDIYPVDFPEPRSAVKLRGTDAFLHLFQKLWQVLMTESDPSKRAA